VAKFPLKPGQRINMNQLIWVNWPKESLTKDYYLRGEKEKLAKLAHMIVRYEIIQGEPVKAKDLVGGDGKSVLAAFVKPNMKAVSIPLKNIVNADVHVVPGDYIDIILSQRHGETETTDTVLTNLKVIAVDNSFYTPEGETPATVPKNITLEVTPEQAEEIALSLASGQIVLSYNSAYTPNAKEVKTVKKNNQTTDIKVNRGSYGQ
jgi:pilus assembly protein CpaB